MAQALCRAMIDHAAIANSISRIVIAEDPTRVPGLDTLQLAVTVLRNAHGTRYPSA